MSIPPETDIERGRYMTRAVVDMIRNDLRVQILTAIKPDVEAAIDAVVKELEVNVARFVDHSLGEQIVKLVIDDRRKKER